MSRNSTCAATSAPTATVTSCVTRSPACWAAKSSIVLRCAGSSPRSFLAAAISSELMVADIGADRNRDVLRHAVAGVLGGEILDCLALRRIKPEVVFGRGDFFRADGCRYRRRPQP